MMNWLYKRLETRIDAQITRRIITFHRALIDRGQIKPLVDQGKQTEVANRCKED